MKKLESKTVKELIAMARQWGLTGYSRLKKAELLKLLTKKVSKQKPSASAKKSKTGTESTPDSKTRLESSRKIEKSSKSSFSDNIVRKARALASKARLTKHNTASKHKKYSRPEISEVEKVTVSPKPKTKKYTTFQPAAEASFETGLPSSYGDGRFGLMARDPHWLYCFWDLSPHQNQELWKSEHAVLRVVKIESSNREVVETIPLTSGAQSWYAYVKNADSEYFCELCCAQDDGSVLIVASSNTSTTPPDFASLQKKSAKEKNKSANSNPESVGNKLTAKAKEKPRQHESKQGHAKTAQSFSTFNEVIAASSISLQKSFSETIDSAVGLSSMHSPGQQGALRQAPSITTDNSNDYWLNMDADVILYGATKPGSKVVLAGVELELDSNGHFRARFALPEGNHSFKLKATSPDEAQTRQVKMTIQQRTEP